MSTSIGKQAENYAEVITGQIVANFDELATAMVECKDLEDAKKAYEKTSPLDNTLTTIDTLRERVKIIEDNLGDIVCDDYNSIEPLAVGLFGEWGSGKTHQLKLIKKHLLTQTRKKDAATIIPVFFNAWRFEKEEHIILPLFQTLLDVVENHERTLKDKAKRGFKSTAYHLKNILFSLHHGISWSSAYKTVRGVATNNLEDMREVANVVDIKTVQTKGKEKTNKEQVGEQSLTQLLQPDQLQSIYLNIPQWIEKITLFENVNFVFLIDDLDRCLPENTLKMLESIKLFLDVPSCAFVLAVDDDVVERGVVHHYRDYLSIYHHKDTENAKGVLQHELPITGHEYLEKMIQLPMRLPVINTQNAREFLEKETQNTWANNLSANMYEQVLDYFACAVPSKPRKLKRVALLYQTKLVLLKELDVDELLLAKITLLELFAPKILRFIQNHGYGKIYDRLNYFVEIDERVTSLNEVKAIKIHIEQHGYSEADRNTYYQLLIHIEEHQRSRVVFDLDKVFNRQETRKELRKIIELNANESTLECNKTTSNNLFKGLDTQGDVVAWKNTLEEHGDLTDAAMPPEIIKIGNKIDKTFNNLPFIANPEWIGVVAEYLSDDEYIDLLQASHNARFKVYDNTDKNKQIDMFQLTFAEYDKYCEITNIQKPKDEGWGRGRRPVINVSWNEAKKYIDWLNAFLGEKDKYRFPKKEDWERACNNGEVLENGKPEWHFGDDESQLKEYAWYNENSDSKTHPVGEKKDNELGLFDMHGNVWEWCEDGDSEEKFLKGGSWYNLAEETDTSNTIENELYISNSFTGFRLHRTLP